MKKATWRKILLILAIIAMIVLVVAVNRYHKTLQIRDIIVDIDYNQTNALVEDKEITKLIHTSFGDLRGKTIKEVDLKKVEEIVSINPFVEKADLYTDFRGNMYVKIKQREPVIRVRDQQGNQFYIDKLGYKFPLSNIGTQNVLIVNGYINIDKNKQNPIVSINIDKKEIFKSESDIEKVYYLATYIKSHPFFKNQIDQIYYNKKGEFELVPKLGNQTILFGNLNRIEEKLENLFYLYKDGFSNTGWSIYKTINLKFENQIVCTK